MIKETGNGWTVRSFAPGWHEKKRAFNHGLRGQFLSMAGRAARLRRKRSRSITLPGGGAVDQPATQGARRDLEPTEPPQLSVHSARIRHGALPDDANDPLCATELGQCIIYMTGPDDRADLRNAWQAISAARRNYLTRYIGQTGDAKGAAFAMTPEPMQTDPGLRIDIRTAAERDTAAKAAWESWAAKIEALPTPMHMWALRGALLGLSAEGGIWRDGKPTATGRLAVVALGLVAEK